MNKLTPGLGMIRSQLWHPPLCMQLCTDMSRNWSCKSCLTVVQALRKSAAEPQPPEAEFDMTLRTAMIILAREAQP